VHPVSRMCCRHRRRRHGSGWSCRTHKPISSNVSEFRLSLKVGRVNFLRRISIPYKMATISLNRFWMAATPDSRA
jgi:hypothetical protein